MFLSTLNEKQSLDEEFQDLHASMLNPHKLTGISLKLSICR